MSASPSPSAPTSTTSASSATALTGRRLWRRARGMLTAAALLVLAGVIVAALRSGDEYGALDPRSTDGDGSRAIDRLLTARGVDTRIVTTTGAATEAAGPDTTLLVTDPEALNKHEQTRIREAAGKGGRTVLVAAGPAATAALPAGVRTASPGEVRPTPPDCAFPAARRAGDADIGGARYSVPAGHGDACYLNQGMPTLLHLPSPRTEGDEHESRSETVLVGAPDPLYNKRLDKRGNASLSLQLLGSRPRLVWYLPSAERSPADDRRGDRSFFSLLPDGWSWAALQLAIAAALAAAWRARRLGRLVPEQLPVPVRASEATEGRARLYRRANARGHAADALRRATRIRLAPLVGVPGSRAHSPGELCPAVAAHDPDHHHGPARTPDDAAPLRTLLFGPAPADDNDLIRLTGELDRLERRITPIAPGETNQPPTDKDRTP